MAAPPRKADIGLLQGLVSGSSAQDGVVALLAIAFNAAAMASTAGFFVPSRPRRCARNAGSLYDRKEAPEAKALLARLGAG